MPAHLFSFVGYGFLHDLRFVLEYSHCMYALSLLKLLAAAMVGVLVFALEECNLSNVVHMEVVKSPGAELSTVFARATVVNSGLVGMGYVRVLLSVV